MKTSARNIAERYVRALFDVAGDTKRRSEVENSFATIAKALKESDSFRDLLANPLLTREQQGQTVEIVLARLQIDALSRQFIAMLAHQKRLPLLPVIIELFMEWAVRARGELRAEIISALPLPPKELDTISARLSKAYGKTVVAQSREDAALLGGVVVKIGSMQLDGSLSGKLRRLGLALKAA